MAFVNKNTGITKRTGYYFQGKEIALTRKIPEGRPIRRRINDDHINEAKKIEIATLYAVTRDFKQVSDLAKVTINKLRQYSKEPWFTNIVAQVTKEKNEELDAKLTAVIDKAIEVISDRLQKGNQLLDRKTKETYRVPVNTKDATIAVDVLFNKRQLLRGESTSNTNTNAFGDRLDKIKEVFSNLGKDGKIIDAESDENSGNFSLIEKIESENKEPVIPVEEQKELVETPAQ